MRAVVLVLSLWLAFAATGCSKTAEKQTMEISGRTISIGAVVSGQQDTNRQKVAYRIVLTNPQRIQIVDSADVLLSKIIKGRVIQTQNESIHYDDQGTIALAGEVIFDAMGLSKEEISQHAPLIGVQFIGDDNKEYFLPLLR